MVLLLVVCLKFHHPVMDHIYFEVVNLSVIFYFRLQSFLDFNASRKLSVTEHAKCVFWLLIVSKF
jgi:hypothetical protein